MRKPVTLALAIAAAIFVSAGAEPGSSPFNPATRVICLDVDGQSRPAICQAPASRLDGRDDFCVCRSAQRVEAPVCGPDDRPPAESRAYELARKDAARDGSLVGDLWEGRPMCVAPRNP